MSKPKFIPILCLAASIAACDSQSQLTASRSGPAPVPVAVTQSTVSLNGSTPTISYAFTVATLPASVAAITSGPNAALVVGGQPASLMTQGPDLVANLPPQTRPPVPDSSGNVPLLVQSNNGSVIIIAHITATPLQILGPTPTASP